MSHTFDVSGVKYAPGDHVCGLYLTTAERDEMLRPYLRDGLDCGDKCLCILDTVDPSTVLSGLGPAADLEPFLARRQLDVRRPEETTLRDGGFSPDRTIEFWDHEAVTALSGGFSFLRGAGEMTWALRRVPGIEELMDFESRLNQYMPRHPQVMLCLYELGRFGSETVVDVLKVHPKVLLGGLLIDNPYYIEPDEFLATRRDRVKATGN
jgi:hypothetical protein